MSTTRGREGATGAANGYRRCAHQYIERDRATASSSRRARMSGSSSIRAAQSASRSDSFVQPRFRQLRIDENVKPRRDFSETTTLMNDSYRRAAPASGQKAAPREGEWPALPHSEGSHGAHPASPRRASGRKGASLRCSGCQHSSRSLGFLNADMSLPTKPPQQAPASAVASAVPTRLIGNKYALALESSFLPHS